MKHKGINYPADYDNDRSLRREHRAGVILVWVLVALIAVSMTVCAALSARGLKMLPKYCAGEQIIGELLPDITAEPKNGTVPNPESGASFDPGALPEPGPTAEPVPTVEPNPDFMDHAAQPFSQSFDSVPDVIEAVAPGVVGVTNWKPYQNSQRLIEWGSGSGFVITTDGYILTNHHVIEDAQKLTVCFTDGRDLEARLVGSDRVSDIAVLKVDAENLIALPKGDSDKLRVGEFVFAIGDPVRSELSGSVTFGIVSAKSREINIDGFTNNYIQTDAAINLGNSGGPLIDLNGFVVGMNSAKTVTAGYDSTGTAIVAEGIGFALPINNVWQIATQLITSGSISKPGIGITIKQTLANVRDIALQQGEEIRPYVDSLTEGGPADLAGMKVKDVILAVDGHEMSEMEEIVAYIREQTTVGKVVTFTVERDGKRIEIPVTIGDLNKMR